MKTHRPLRQPAPGGERGVVLLWTVLAVFVMMGATFVTASLSRTAGIRASLSVSRARAESLSHGATEQALREIQGSLRIGAMPSMTGTLTVDGETASYVIEEEAPPVPSKSRAGLNLLTAVYRVIGSATVDGVQMSTNRVVKARLVPIFQFAIFYENDLEFYNPAPWEIHGRVHCNSDIYIRTGRRLQFDTNYLHAVGNVYGRPPHATYNLLSGEAPYIRRWTADPFDPLEPVDYSTLPTIEEYAASSLVTTGGLDSDFFGSDLNGDGDFFDPGEFLPFLPATLDLFGPSLGTGDSTLQTSEHGVLALSAPEIDDLAPFVAAPAGGDWDYDAATGTYAEVAPGDGSHNKGYYFDRAGLVLEMFPTGSWAAYNGEGTDVTAALASAISVTSMFDRRQAGATTDAIQQLEVDMAALVATGLFPANGLLHMTGYGAGPGTAVKAFTVKNGADLPSGLTMVSPNSIYVQGDFNTVLPKPAAAIADAVNLLSNAWDNTKTPGTLPNATETTYHLSIVAGDVASTPTVGSGGPHNLPRRHENWSGIPENLIGSIVSTYRSQYATGDFQVGSDFYRPPNRFWTFDDRNNDVENLPPFTPVTVDVAASITWTARP